MVTWCDVCRTFVCIDCDALHDCTGLIIGDDDEEEPEPVKSEDFTPLFPQPELDDEEDDEED